MRYALLVSHNENAVISPQEAARRDRALQAFLDDAQERGVLAASELLQPASTATTIRAWDGGDVFVRAGSSAQATEHICSVFVIESKDLDEAITVATRVPAAWYGTVEVREVLESRSPAPAGGASVPVAA
jgi:hypothetical protein